MRRYILSVSAVSLVLLAGCSSAAPVAEEVPEPVASPTAVASPTYEPVETSAPPVAAGPFDAAPIGTGSVELNDEDGYQASVTVDWLPEISYSTADITPSCMDALVTAGFTRGWTDAQVSLRAFPVKITPSYPDVNGFTWPAEKRILGDISYSDPNGGSDYVMRCIDGMSDAAIRLQTPDTGGGVTEVLAVFYEPKTPNNPNGDRDITPSALTFQTERLLGVTCGPSGDRTCSLSHP